MSPTRASQTSRPIRLQTIAVGIAVIWTLFMLALLGWNTHTEKTGTHEAARIQARTAFEKDVLYRRWNASLGRIYAPATEKSPPNPYLDVPDRDIETPQGQRLTTINPAYMTRQVHEIAMDTYGVKGHITSLDPIRPENAPDEWEIEALKAFQDGAEEISSIEMIDGQKHMRLMRPLITEASCLGCHAVQGYQLGEIRGGISVAVPLGPLTAIEKKSLVTLTIIDALLWLAGLAGIGFGMHLLNRQIDQRLQAEAELREKEKLRGVIEMAGAVCHELNQPMQTILGNLELIMMQTTDDDPMHGKIAAIKQQIDRMGKITHKLMRITRYETTDYLNDKIIDIDKASR